MLINCLITMIQFHAAIIKAVFDDLLVNYPGPVLGKNSHASTQEHTITRDINYNTQYYDTDTILVLQRTATSIQLI